MAPKWLANLNSLGKFSDTFWERDNLQKGKISYSQQWMVIYVRSKTKGTDSYEMIFHLACLLTLRSTLVGIQVTSVWVPSVDWMYTAMKTVRVMWCQTLGNQYMHLHVCIHFPVWDVYQSVSWVRELHWPTGLTHVVRITMDTVSLTCENPLMWLVCSSFIGQI